ncbi:zinc ribbon-containing protein [Christensenellaceae bacterium OttesenSCG-928-K19]|nr:zinc ribbon-containing protein [Christensenellaceae bacterium OttesenSCG-928-K19]
MKKDEKKEYSMKIELTDNEMEQASGGRLGGVFGITCEKCGKKTWFYSMSEPCTHCGADNATIKAYIVDQLDNNPIFSRR